ncbi:class I SAM-dependent methyltransferase [Streptomyces sp. NPDC012888]|uniref:class I SAM-dependent methyltransferase n=1 Tax=Streptomyces sp. NPDC012888 TaxID=3364855 RepID=UPI00369A8748
MNEGLTGELVARQLDEQITQRYPVGQRLRILDAGMGRGAQTLRLARAGHRVTGVESDPELLAAAQAAVGGEPAGIQERVRLVAGDSRETGAQFLPGSFDVVLCHGVPSADPDALLAGLARMLAPGGLLSLLVRNADAAAMAPGRAGDWSAALAAVTAPDAVGAGRLDALTSTLAGIGAPLSAWYGVGVFPGTDDVSPDRLAAEDRAGRTEPYRRVAERLHLCGVRGGA